MSILGGSTAVANIDVENYEGDLATICFCSAAVYGIFGCQTLGLKIRAGRGSTLCPGCGVDILSIIFGVQSPLPNIFLHMTHDSVVLGT